MSVLLSRYLAPGEERCGEAAFLNVSSDGEDINLGLNEETLPDRVMIPFMAW